MKQIIVFGFYFKNILKYLQLAKTKTEEVKQLQVTLFLKE